MAKVKLRTVFPPDGDYNENVVRRISDEIYRLAYKCGEHEVVEDASSADLVLLCPTFTLHFSHIDKARLSIRRHPLRVEFPDKCFVFDPDDSPSPFVPGVFASLDNRYWNRRKQKAGPYLHGFQNATLRRGQDISEARHLFSFVGSPSTHKVRERILTLIDKRGLVIGTNAQWPEGQKERDRFKQQYIDSFHDSKFVLCPRGRGTSSARLFDAMRVGRVPVIISDNWVAPDGPEWERFSVRVSEKDVEQIPELLTKLESQTEAMAAAALQAYKEWFSEGQVFGRIVDSCLELKANDWRRWDRVYMGMQLCRASVMKRFVLGPLLDLARSERNGGLQ